MNDQKNLDSCHDQLGKIPDGWSMVKLKYLVDFNSETLDNRTDPDFEFNYIQISDVDQYSGIKFGKKIRFKDAPSRARRVLRKNDIIISTVSAYMRTISQVPECQNLIGSTGFCVLRKKNNKLNFRYLYYFVVSDWFIDRLISESEGVCYPIINSSDLVKLKVLTPPPPTDQELIAHFLDKKTYLIDSLIKRIQKKIELLKEQRISLINHCVTNGLDSNVETKDSGVKWICEIPKNWETVRLKYLTNSQKELSKSGEEELLSVTEKKGIVKRRELKGDDENLSRSENLIGYRIVKKGDLVNNIMLVWKRGLGVSSYDGIVSPAYSVFSFNNNCDPTYFNYLLRSDVYISEFRRNSKGITNSRLRLYDNSFENVIALLPPLIEQKSISRYLDKKNEIIDKTIFLLEKKINLYSEYRQTLISSVVTGKISVSEGMR